jgi:hypothetical protein
VPLWCGAYRPKKGRQHVAAIQCAESSYSLVPYAVVFNTRVSAIMSCRACLRAVKAAMM